MILSVSCHTAKLEEQRMHDAQVPMLIDAGNAENPEQPPIAKHRQPPSRQQNVLNGDESLEWQPLPTSP